MAQFLSVFSVGKKRLFLLTGGQEVRWNSRVLYKNTPGGVADRFWRFLRGFRRGKYDFSNIGLVRVFNVLLTAPGGQNRASDGKIIKGTFGHGYRVHGPKLTRGEHSPGSKLRFSLPPPLVYPGWT